MLIGYARVSTDHQDTAAQVAALEAAGCERIFREKASAGRWERPQFLRLLNQLRAGDVVVVWKLDRLSRSLRDLLTIMEQLGEAGAGFRSLTEAIDTTTPAGRMMMQMVGAFAEFERAMLRGTHSGRHWAAKYVHWAFPDNLKHIGGDDPHAGDAIEALLVAGADPMARNVAGETPWDLAKAAGTVSSGHAPVT